MSDHNADGRSTSKPGGSRTIAATCSSGRGDAAAATSHGGQLSHFVDDSCLKNVALEDDVGSAAEEEETKALRADSLATVDTAQEEERERKVIVVCDGSYLFTVLGALRVALLVVSGLSLICLASAGTSDYDVLQLPRGDRIRLHLFVTVFTFILTFLLVLVDNSSLFQVFPLDWCLVVSCFLC